MTEPKREPREMMTPRQHYAAAVELVTDGLNKMDRAMLTVETVGASWQARSELIALAQVHATLATVPQSQFDAWKAEVRRPADAEPMSTCVCTLCGRLLFKVDDLGHIEQPTPARHWEWSDGKATCSEDDPAGCQGTGRLPGQQVRASAAAGDRGVHNSPDGRSHVGRIEDCGSVLCVRAQASVTGYRHRQERGDEVLCPHGASTTRCRFCHPDEIPSTVCGACSTPCWSLSRMAGSRCDLVGCAGLMVAWPGPKP